MTIVSPRTAATAAGTLAIILAAPSSSQVADQRPTQLPQFAAHETCDLTLPHGLPAQFQATVCLGGESVELELALGSLRHPDFKVLVDIGRGELVEVEAPPVRTYRGIVKGELESAAAVSLLESGLQGMITRADGTMWYVEPLSNLDAGAPAGRHVAYRAEDVFGIPGSCGVDLLATPVVTNVADLPDPPDDEGGVAGGPIYVCEIACDADFEYYQKNSSTVLGTVSDIETLMASVSSVYESDVGITYEITTIVVRSTSDDPYTTTDAGALLCEFRTTWNSAPESSIQREVGHLFTGKSLLGTTLGVGWIGVVCNQTGVDCGSFGQLAYSLVESKAAGLSFGSRTALSAHELGHNWGAQHCDSQSPCHIMCAGLGGCDGIAGSNLKFGPFEQGQITAYRNSVSCDLLLPAAQTLPFYEPFNSISTSKWIYNKGGAVGTAALNEPSPTTSLVLDAVGSNAYQDDEIRSNFVLLGGVPNNVTFSYYVSRTSVEAGEKLFVDYLNSTLKWVQLNELISDGVNQTNFTQYSHILPGNAKHDKFRMRFRVDVSDTTDDWFIDDVRLDAIPLPSNDECASALPVGDGSVAFDTVGATNSSPFPPISCNDGNFQTLTNDLWYLYTAPCTGLVTISTCGSASFDTRILVYAAGACPAAATPVIACDDNSAGCANGTSLVTFPAIQGTGYLVRLGGINATGTGTLGISCAPFCPDLDSDGICDGDDNCPSVANPGQADGDGDSVGDACDNCPLASNPLQEDANRNGIGDACEAPACPADFSGDGTVDGADLGTLLAAWGTPNPQADLNDDGVVDGADLGALLAAWGSCPS